MKRRELFGSLFSSFKQDKQEERILRPPYNCDENLFFTNCTKCNGACSNVCEENIITIENFMPKLNLQKSGCTYCDECANVCEYGVLEVKNRHNIKANIQIDPNTCLSWSKTMCFSCKDPCLDNAIDFVAMFNPTINDNCTSCGFCIKTCPVGAIKIKA